MKWLQTAWPFLRDVVINGTGLAGIWLQLALWAAGTRDPSWPLLSICGGMLGLPAAAHVRHLWSAGSSSPPSPSPSPAPSPPSLPQGGTGER